LAAVKKSLEDRFGFLAGEIKKAEDYKNELSKRQQQLIAEKTQLFNTSVGDVSSSSDPASRADYNPGFSPAFGAFSFGAPHRKGMSQYGAFGRAKEGQNYETILKAYYGNIRIETVDSPGSINTSVGSLPFEDNYLVGIAEMPASWGDQGGFEALKAQAIAARTYALSYIGWRLSNRNASGSICVTEACQVYKTSRYNSPGKWKEAVEATRGQVLVSNSSNEIFSSMYASTAGGATYSYSSLGHSTPQLWDTSCNNQSCWPNDSFEKTAGSAWYYKGWYKTRSNLSCGRSHPWLTNSEFSDIINAVLYFSKTNDSTHLTQIDSGGCFGGNDPNAWSREELARQETHKGRPVSSVNSISVDYSTSGYTNTVRVSTDKGDFSFNGSDFKDIFVLRAPGAIALKSNLFNIIKK
jgi:SpoIID/LytB domain protein